MTSWRGFDCTHNHQWLAVFLSRRFGSEIAGKLHLSQGAPQPAGKPPGAPAGSSASGAAGGGGGYSSDWRPHVLSNMPFYECLLPHFLELTFSRCARLSPIVDRCQLSMPTASPKRFYAVSPPYPVPLLFLRRSLSRLAHRWTCCERVAFHALHLRQENGGVALPLCCVAIGSRLSCWLAGWQSHGGAIGMRPFIRSLAPLTPCRLAVVTPMTLTAFS